MGRQDMTLRIRSWRSWTAIFALLFSLAAADYPESFLITFQRASDTACDASYIIDIGSAYGDRGTLVYGWVNAVTGLPQDATTNTRARTEPTASCIFNKFIHMQYNDCCNNNGVGNHVEWKIAVPNAWYKVEAHVGEPLNTNSKHSIALNEVDILIRRGPEYAGEDIMAFGYVEVTNGEIKISAENRGYNTKLNSLMFEQLAGPPEEIPEPPEQPPEAGLPCIPSPSQWDGEKKISELPCESVLIETPYSIGFDGNDSGIQDRNLLGTGFTMYLPADNKGNSYFKNNLIIKNSRLFIRSRGGTFLGTANSLQNALGVGLPLPDDDLSVAVKLQLPGTLLFQNERVCAYFGISQKDFIWACVVSFTDGVNRLVIEKEENDVLMETAEFPLIGLQKMSINLEINIFASTNMVEVKYAESGDLVQAVNWEAPPDWFTKDAAGTDFNVRTRSFTGIVASKGDRSSNLSYRLLSYGITVIEEETDDQTDVTIDFDTWFVEGMEFPTAMDFGKDGKLYVAQVTGHVNVISLDVANRMVISRNTYLPIGFRLLLGLAVDPDSTATETILWLSHSDVEQDSGDANSGTITKVSGSSLEHVEDVIIGLPRAIANHAPNQLHFSPSGILYFTVGSNTGGGVPNAYTSAFGPRPEQYFAAALLKADVKNPTFNGNCTPAEDPVAMDASGISTSLPTCDVQIHASGVRNSFDFEFHPNGFLYLVDNGLGGKGTCPKLPDGYVDGDSCQTGPHLTEEESIAHDPGVHDDLLINVEEGAYYGHPNPVRGECVCYAGNNGSRKVDQSPGTGATYDLKVEIYPAGTPPQSSFSMPMYSLGKNRSPNGIISYAGDAFCESLKENLLVSFYSKGDQIRRLILSGDGNSVAVDEVLRRSTEETGAPDRLRNPLALTQDPAGNIYVSEFFKSRVRVLTPAATSTCTRRIIRPNDPAHLYDVGYTTVHGRKLAVVGGKTIDGDAAVSDIHVYDGIGHEWRRLTAQLPLALERSAVAAVDANRAITFGGFDANGTESSAAFIVNLEEDSVEACAPLLTARGGAVSLPLTDGRVMIIGGVTTGDNAQALSSVLAYDPSTNTYEELQPLLTARYEAFAVNIDDHVYVCGGRDVNNVLSSCEKWDSGSWVAVESMGKARTAALALVVDGRMVVKGGEEQDGSVSRAVEMYNPSTDTWTNLMTMQVGRSRGAVARVGRNVFGFAGRTSNGNEAELIQFRPL